MTQSQFIALALVAAVLAPAIAQAEPPSATPSSPAKARATLSLSVELGATEHAATPANAEAIRNALELELRRPVALSASNADADLRVLLNPNRTVTVGFRGPNGPRTRTIGLPQDPVRGPEVIALLAGNLTRDEAAELLAELGAEQAADTSREATTNRPESVPQPMPTPPQAAPIVPRRAPAPRSKPDSAKQAPRALAEAPFNLSLAAPIALFPRSSQRSFNLELGLFYSHVGELRGVGLNAIALNSEGRVQGLGAAGVAQSSGSVDGAQLSGAVNISRGPSRGVSAAGALNLGNDLVGTQLAGAMNRAHDVEGLQAAGAVNIASRISGLQIGVVNVAREVNGLQLGVVNVAQHVKGTSIGLVSVAGNGRVQPVLFASTQAALNAGVKFTIGPIYSQLGLGYPAGGQGFQYELGLGAHLPLGRWFVEPGVHYSELRDKNHFFGRELLEYAHYRLVVGTELGPVSPFVGGAVLQRFVHHEGAPSSVPLTGEAFAGAAFF